MLYRKKGQVAVEGEARLSHRLSLTTSKLKAIKCIIKFTAGCGEGQGLGSGPFSVKSTFFFFKSDKTRVVISALAVE